MESEIMLLVIVAALHLIIGGVHHYAHVVAEAELSLLQRLFILLVVTIAPWATTYIAWKKNLRVGAALFSASMAASLVFGIIFHFAVDSPDLYSNVIPEHRTIFLHSALGLALVELAGFLFGTYLSLRRRIAA